MRNWRALLAAALACVLLGTGLTVPAAGFRDVPRDHWAAASIKQAVESGLVQGETGDVFGLGKPMSRGDFMVALCQLFGWEKVSPEAGSFEDNWDKSSPHFSAIETALVNGAVIAETKRFRPLDAITREEMAVMLVRALGYATLAGLAGQDLGLECPFEDVESNRTYVTLACRMGLASGVTDKRFDPNQKATREAAAVMLIRAQERLKASAPERVGIAGNAAEIQDLYDCAAVAAYSVRMNAAGDLSGAVPGDAELALRETVRSAGKKALIRITCGELTVKADPASVAASIARTAGGWDGVILDIMPLTDDTQKRYGELVRQVKKALADGQTLYAVVETPPSEGGAEYDYALINQEADHLILRAAAYDKVINGFSTLPQEPLEEVYYGLVALRGKVDFAKCSLWLTTNGVSRAEGKKSGGYATPRQIRERLDDPETGRHYSARYASAYITYTEELEDRDREPRNMVVWYHDQRSAATRVRLASFFGVESVCLSNINALSGDPECSVLPGLGGA